MIAVVKEQREEFGEESRAIVAEFLREHPEPVRLRVVDVSPEELERLEEAGKARHLRDWR